MRTRWRTVLAASVVFGAAVSVTLRAQPSRSVWDGVYTEEQEKRGREVYERECLFCHGSRLEGGEGPALADGVFRASWNGLTLGELLDVIRETMPSQSPGSLDRQDVADVLAHILSANGMPAGEKELERRSELLESIRFDAEKPDS